MIPMAVKRGTTSWRATEALEADEVEYVGEWVYAPDGYAAYMVWDVALDNCRPMTPAEIASFNAEVTHTQAANAKAAALATLNALDVTATDAQGRLIRGILTALVWAFNQPPGQTITLQDLKTQAAMYIANSAG